MNIAFLYNIRHQYPDPNDPRSQLEADFDDPQTIDWMIRHLRNLGHKIIPIEADEKAYLELYNKRRKIDLALNYAEGIYGADRESQLPAMLEMLQIPYTGSKPLTQALVLNKAKTKEILLANHIKTADFQVYYNLNQPLSPHLHFPLLVKPIAQGSSAGITNKSVVKNIKSLKKQVAFVFKHFKQPALIENYLTGEEYSVAMIGNPPTILPIISPDHDLLPPKYNRIDSLEVKWQFEESSGGSKYLRCPAKIPKNKLKKIREICLATWRALEIIDWCRIDLRADDRDNIYVLEVNSPAGLIPPEVSQTSYFPLAARSFGWEYEELLSVIIKTAAKRYNLV